MNGIDVSKLRLYTHAASIGFGVDCSDECHAGKLLLRNCSSAGLQRGISQSTVYEPRGLKPPSALWRRTLESVTRHMRF